MGAPLGLDALALLLEVVKQLVIVLVEHHSRDLVQARHDVSSAGRVLAALQPRSELTWCTRACSVTSASRMSTFGEIQDCHICEGPQASIQMDPVILFGAHFSAGALCLVSFHVLIATVYIHARACLAAS